MQSIESVKLPIPEIVNLIETVEDFPQKGIHFKDITPVLEDANAFQSLIEHFADSIDPNTTKLVAIESRGFIFGAAIAHHLGIGLVLVRKPGKLPRETHRLTYDLEYGTDTLEIHKTALTADDKVTIIDDVLATGGTANAVEQLIEQIGAEVLGHRFFLEISALNGRSKLRASTTSFYSC